uniref:Protein kinase domain-containing protein n=1 Tax=Kryptolebias marmoratus TaxID=37003 RepID=A0A3Q3B8Z0_KRYMA
LFCDFLPLEPSVSAHQRPTDPVCVQTATRGAVRNPSVTSKVMTSKAIVMTSSPIKGDDVTQILDSAITQWTLEVIGALRFDRTSGLNDYSIAAILRYGNFSNIATCRKEKTEEVFVLKCIKKKHYNSEERELKALKCLKSLDPDKNNIVRFFECFEFKDCICLAFEKLDINLQEFMIRRNCRPLRVSEVRAIAHQMLVALKALTQIRITHANIKPESILLVDHLAKPFKVKLTDFGAAAETKKLSEVVIPLTYGYSAPEMFWDSPLDSSVDIWGLGCTLAYIFLGQNLYPTDCEYNYVRSVVNLTRQQGRRLNTQTALVII